MDTEHCAACHRIFNARSKPRWAFTPKGYPAGRIHTGCSAGWNGHYVHSDDISQDAAHFWAWERHFRPRAQKDPAQAQAEWDALGWLFGEPGDTIDERGEEALRELATGHSTRTPEQITAVRVAYHRLVGEFNAWRATLRAVGG